MKDPADHVTADLIPAAEEKRGKGRPAKYHDDDAKKAAAAEAAKRYRDKKRAERDARRDPAQPVTSSIIDLSEVRQWK